MFGNIPQNLALTHLALNHLTLNHFPGMFDEIPQDVFLRIFGIIPWNVWHRSPGIFGETLRNLWRLSPEYNAAQIPRPSHNGPLIPFPVPLFLILCIAYLV